MKNSLETKLGIFVVLVIFAAVFIVEILGGVESFRGGYHVNAQFNSAQDLKVGDTVKMAGVEIGRVEKIWLDETNNQVDVQMRLRSDAIVRTDSKAIVKFTGLMGQYFVSISFGSATSPKVLDGALLESEEQPDLNAIMAKLDAAATGIQNMTKSFTPDTINNLFGPLTDFVKHNSDSLSATITNLKNVSGQIASGEGTVGKLIYDQTLYNSALTTVSNLQDSAADAKDLIASAKLTVNEVNSGHGTLGKLLKDETLYNSTTGSMTNLQQILMKINQGQGTVGKLVNDQEFYKNAKVSLQKLDKAADSLEDQGPISILGILANNLF